MTSKQRKLRQDYTSMKEQKEEEVKELQCNLQYTASQKDALEGVVDCLQKGNQELEEQLQNFTADRDAAVSEVEMRRVVLEGRCMQLQSSLETVRVEKAELENQLQTTVVEKDCADSEFQKERQAYEERIHQLKSTVESMNNEKKQLEHSLASKDRELAGYIEGAAKVPNPADLENLMTELESWRQKYNDLSEKVRPFKEQLEAFEMEKQALMGMTRNTQSEMEKLSAEYARLLGHQNQKQKIKHILKLKEENNSLKLEFAKVKEQANRSKRQVDKLQEQVSHLEGKKRFDPRKAFQHDKENTPLKDGNR